MIHVREAFKLAYEFNTKGDAPAESQTIFHLECSHALLRPGLRAVSGRGCAPGMGGGLSPPSPMPSLKNGQKS
jgi:hypothetical protein